MKENQFKYRIFYLLLLAKLIVVGTLLFELDTNGFSTSEVAATLTLILPLFAAYTTIIFKEFSNSPFEEEGTFAPPRIVKPFIVRSAHVLIILYGLIIAILISQKPVLPLSFSDLQAAIAGVESFLGVYIGQIIFVLFGSHKKIHRHEMD